MTMMTMPRIAMHGLVAYALSQYNDHGGAIVGIDIVTLL